MSSQIIEDFIEHSTTIPREVIRVCKLIKEVDEITNEKIAELDKKRHKFLQNKKLKSENLTDLKAEIDKDHKYLMELNDYKIEHLKELEYVVKTHIVEVELSTKEYEDEFRKTHGCSPRISKFLFTFQNKKILFI
jgi:hypothetical protein